VPRFASALSLAIALAGCRQTRAAGEDAAHREREPAPGPRLELGEISFAGPGGHRPDASFTPGEVVSCLFSVRNFTYRDGKADLKGAITVSGPRGEVVLAERALELMKGAAPTARPGTLRSAAQLRISAAAPPGRYGVELRLRDQLARPPREGVGKARFTFVGRAEPGADHLALRRLRWAAGGSAAAGSVVPVAFSVAGMRTRRVAGSGHRLDLAVEAVLRDAGGQRVGGRAEPLARGELPFAPESHPFEVLLDVPRGLAAGSYRLGLEVSDLVTGSKAAGELALAVREVPGQPEIANLHLHDVAGLPRDEFLLGEQVFVRLALLGLRARGTGDAAAVDASLDLAVAGPDGGVYLAHKRAVEARGAGARAAARAGRFPAQIPIVLPSLAPVGRYRFVIRARDALAGKEATAELPFTVRGGAPRPLDRFTIERLEVRDRPDLPPSAGDTFVAGRGYHVALVVGGVKPAEKRKLIYEVTVEGGLKLLDLAGRTVDERRRLFVLRRELGFKPLRLVVPAEWRPSAGLRPGLYDLLVEASHGEHASQLRRRVEIVRAK
jgi:hypothetical protein